MALVSAHRSTQLLPSASAVLPTRQFCTPLPSMIQTSIPSLGQAKCPCDLLRACMNTHAMKAIMPCRVFSPARAGWSRMPRTNNPNVVTPPNSIECGKLGDCWHIAMCFGSSLVSIPCGQHRNFSIYPLRSSGVPHHVSSTAA